MAHLASDGPRPVYALDGDERILIDEALVALKGSVLKSGLADFNLDVFSAREATPDRALAAARTIPAFSSHRLVVVKDAEQWEKADATALLDYLAHPSPSTVLVLVAEDKFDGRLKLGRALERHGALIRFARPHLRQLPAIVAARAKALGTTIDSEGMHALLEAVGPSVSLVTLALEKLALYRADDPHHRPITRADVEALISPVKEESIFEFADAVGRKDFARALVVLHTMLSVSRTHPLAMLGLLAGHWRRIAIAHTLLARRAPRTELEAELRVPPFVVDRLVSQARQHTTEDLVAGLHAIRTADALIKGSKLGDERAMDWLLVRLIPGDRAAERTP